MSSELHACDQRIRDLLRLAVGHGIDPDIVGRRRTVVVVEQARAVASEGGFRAAQMVYAFGQRQGSGLSGSEIVHVDVGVAVDVGGPGNGFAVGREIAAFDFPFVLGEPVDFLGRDVEQADVVVAIAGVRGDQQMLAVGRKIVGGVELPLPDAE